MPALWKIPLLAALAGRAAVAQTTVVDFLMIGNDYFDSVGYVVKIESSITTVLVSCDPQRPTSTCPLGSQSVTIYQGSSTYQWIQPYVARISSPSFTSVPRVCDCLIRPFDCLRRKAITNAPWRSLSRGVSTQNCSLNTSNAAYSCTETVSDEDSVTTSTISEDGYTDFLYAVAVTAGADKLPTGLGRKASDDIGPGATTPGRPYTTSGQAGTTHKSNAAARPAVTQNAALVGAGLAALAVAL